MIKCRKIDANTYPQRMYVGMSFTFSKKPCLPKFWIAYDLAFSTHNICKGSTA